ncbi:trans-sialidase [Trypanosoma cruzi cruzi]|uniref:Putative trans-sialidase, Group V n=1 Tax=Trypanosoma cruzi TaxID=5693 RepID=A0A2V2W3H8_TRYCR|nr:trans-sialidase [Trypanosoma cruzi cruzi]PWV03170.1 putative trans-sialidase, Group V [Trypanosoma cruzi]
MLSRVAAVMAPRTDNRRRVTGSSGRRREGRESEPQRHNMSRHLFYSAVLLLVVMVCCGTGGAAQDPEQASDPKFEWKEVKDEVGVTVESLSAPGLLKVGSDVFAVAEVQCKDSQNTVFTGIASQLLTKTADSKPEEVLKDAKDTQILEEATSKELTKELHVSRPTAVVEGSNIYILVGKHSHEAADTCQAEAEKIKSGMLLVKGEVGEGVNKKIRWNETGGLPCTIGEEHKSLSQLIFGGGSGVKLRDATFLFPVEATKKKENEKYVKTASLIIHNAASWNLSKGMSADGCSDPSVLEWEKDKLMMMTACDDGRRRVYEIGDKGESWTEALGTLSRVWFNKKGNERGVRSGFTTATIYGDGEMRNVMLVTLPVYPKGKEKGELRLWLTDNTHIVDIGSVSGDDDVAASALLYKSGNNKEELIALYEKKGDEDKPSPGMVSVLLTEQLKRVKEVLATWKEVDERVSKLCLSENAKKDAPIENACSTAVKITAGLVGFLSGNFSGTTWKDEYLGVNATVNKEDGATVATDNGVKFTGRGAWAEWPVGKQGDNQLYHFANYNFTLVATVSIHGVPKKDTPIPLMGAKMDGGDNGKTVLLGLSYNKEKKWQALCSGQTTAEHGSNWEPHTTYQVVIVLQNGTQGSAYVDGKSVGDESCVLKIADSKEISHFYIGGDGSDAGNTRNQEAFSVTVSNVMLYNRPLDGNEITALAKNKITIPKPEGPNTLVVATPSTAVSGQVAQKTVSVSTPGESTVNHESSVSSGEDEGTAGGTDEQGEKGIHPQHGEVNATALNSSIVNSSQGNNSDGGTMRGSGLLPSLLLLGLWGFAAQ